MCKVRKGAFVCANCPRTKGQAVRYNIRLCTAVIRLMFLRQAVDSATGLFWFNTVIYFLYRGASLFFYPISKKFNIGIQNELARRREIKEE